LNPRGSRAWTPSAPGNLWPRVAKKYQVILTYNRLPLMNKKTCKAHSKKIKKNLYFTLSLGGILRQILLAVIRYFLWDKFFLHNINNNLNSGVMQIGYYTFFIFCLKHEEDRKKYFNFLENSITLLSQMTKITSSFWFAWIQNNLLALFEILQHYSL